MICDDVIWQVFQEMQSFLVKEKMFLLLLLSSNHTSLDRFSVECLAATSGKQTELRPPSRIWSESHDYLCLSWKTKTWSTEADGQTLTASRLSISRTRQPNPKSLLKPYSSFQNLAIGCLSLSTIVCLAFLCCVSVHRGKCASVYWQGSSWWS